MKKLLSLGLCASLGLLTTGCAGIGVNIPTPSGFQDLIAHMGTATRADLVHADAIAHARKHLDGTPWPDQYQIDCYENGLMPLLDSVQTNAASPTDPNLTINGAISAFAALRNTVKVGQATVATAAIPDYVVRACGPLALDIQNDVATFTKGAASLPFGLKFTPNR